MPDRKSTERVQVGLRLREAIRAKLEKSAKMDGVSLNAEIESRVEESFRREERATDIRKAVVDDLAESVGGESRLRQLMLLGQHLHFVGHDIAAKVPLSGTFQTTIIQVPTTEGVSGVGNFTTWGTTMDVVSARDLHDRITKTIAEFQREKSK